MAKKIDIELLKAESRLQTIAGDTFLPCIDQIAHAVCECFFSELSSICSEAPYEHKADATRLHQIIRPFIKTFLHEKKAYIKFIQPIVSLQDSFQECIAKNITLWIYRTLVALDGIIEQVALQSMVINITLAIRENIEEWDHIFCQGRFSTGSRHTRKRPSDEKNSLKKQNSIALQQGENRKGESICKKYTKIAEDITQKIILPEGIASLYLPISPLIAFSISPFISSHAVSFFTSICKEIVHHLLSRPMRLVALSYIPTYYVPSLGYHKRKSHIESTSQNSEEEEKRLYHTSSRHDDEAIKIGQENILAICSVLFPDLWKQYMRYIPLTSACTSLYQSMGSSTEENTYYSMRQRYILTLCTKIAAHLVAPAQCGHTSSLQESSVIENLEIWIQNPNIVEFLTSCYMTLSKKKSATKEETGQPKTFAIAVAEEIKNQMTKKIAASAHTLLQWDKNAPFFIKKMSYYLLSDSFAMLLEQALMSLGK